MECTDQLPCHGPERIARPCTTRGRTAVSQSEVYVLPGAGPVANLPPLSVRIGSVAARGLHDPACGLNAPCGGARGGSVPTLGACTTASRPAARTPTRGKPDGRGSRGNEDGPAGGWGIVPRPSATGGVQRRNPRQRKIQLARRDGEVLGDSVLSLLENPRRTSGFVTKRTMLPEEFSRSTHFFSRTRKFRKNFSPDQLSIIRPPARTSQRPHAPRFFSHAPNGACLIASLPPASTRRGKHRSRPKRAHRVWSAHASTYSHRLVGAGRGRPSSRSPSR